MNIFVANIKLGSFKYLKSVIIFIQFTLKMLFGL